MLIVVIMMVVMMMTTTASLYTGSDTTGPAERAFSSGSASVLHASGAQMLFVVCWLLNVPATGYCISGTDLLRQFDVLPH